MAYWWAVLLMGIALIMLMAGFIKICSVHTPSSNPKLPPHKPLPGTLKRRRPPQTAQPPQRQRPRESYQMGHMRRWLQLFALVLPSAYNGKTHSKENLISHCPQSNSQKLKRKKKSMICPQNKWKWLIFNERIFQLKKKKSVFLEYF